MSLCSLRNWIQTFPEGFFNQNFEVIYNDELKFLANADACSTDNRDDTKKNVDAKGVNPGSNYC